MKKEDVTISERYNCPDENWIVDYGVYPEQGYYIEQEENEYR